MKIFIFLLQLIVSNIINAEENETEHLRDDIKINEIAGILVKTLRLDTTFNETRFKELKSKIDEINTYVIDKEKFAELLLNETQDPNLNQTNFLNALDEKNDYYSFLTEKDHKSLIVKLKEKMNRDDIVDLVVRRSQANAAKDTRRKLMPNIAMIENNHVLNNAIDDILARPSHDQHEFVESKEHAQLWDPQVEMEKEISGRRIYHGERSNIRDYPFMVSIHVITKFWCGGVLYATDLVITSSSCLQLMHNNRFYRENPNVLTVRIGSNHSRLGGELLDALEVYFHPGYDPKTLKNNLAVIRTRVHVRFNYHRIPKILSISHSKNPPPPTTRVLILGWGVTRENQKMSYEPVFLQKKVLPVFPNMFCKEIYGDKFVNERMFCAGTMTTGEGACDHDAGGPAIMNGRLIGIISYGPTNCGYPETPTVFTLVGAFSDWIETINETMPKYYRYRLKQEEVKITEDPFEMTTTLNDEMENELLYEKIEGPTDGRIDDKDFTLYPLFHQPGFNFTETTHKTTDSSLLTMEPIRKKHKLRKPMMKRIKVLENDDAHVNILV